MSSKKILISPLNWGFGHAGRMLALAKVLKSKGHAVIFGADRSLIPLLENDLPGTEIISIPGVRVRYSRFLPQYLCIFLQLPCIIASSIKEHNILKKIAASHEPEIIISDSRFGLFHREIFSVYITHQLRIPFPRLLRFIEPAGALLHRMIIKKYDLCLIPDYPGPENLSGRLSHDVRLTDNVSYMGPLSRFLTTVPATNDSAMVHRPYACIILSGPEPQRSLLLKEAAAAVEYVHPVILTVTPLPSGFTVSRGATVLTNPDTPTMMNLIIGSEVVITRAGYTSVMELSSLGKGAVLIPTPGQTEQKYLGRYLNGRYGFVTVKQQKIEREGIINPEAGRESSTVLPDTTHLLENALYLLLQNEKK
jgi:hypothetical protein